MGVNLLIDGYNLIGSGGSGLEKLEEARQTLLKDLAVYKRITRASVTVVFDGCLGMPEPASRVAGIEVIFSRGREADAVIKEITGRKRQGLTVVTSDRELASFAKSMGAVVLGSDEFATILVEALYQDLKGIDPLEEEDGPPEKKGPSRRPAKQDRIRNARIKKLRGR